MVKPNSTPDPGPPAALGDGFLLLGRLAEEKGVRLLLEAWRRQPDGAFGTLRIAGDGPLRPEVEAVAAGRADVAYLGPPTAPGYGRPCGTRRWCSLPSVWADVLPTVILEALAAGRPVLGTDLGGIPYRSAKPAGPYRPQWTVWWPDCHGPGREAPAMAPAARRRYQTTFGPEIVLDQLLVSTNRTGDCLQRTQSSRGAGGEGDTGQQEQSVDRPVNTHSTATVHCGAMVSTSPATRTTAP